jgi:hypothetical protein
LSAVARRAKAVARSVVSPRPKVAGTAREKRA